MLDAREHRVDLAELIRLGDGAERAALLQRGYLIRKARDAEDKIACGGYRDGQRRGKLRRKRAQGGDYRLVAAAGEQFVLFDGVDD